MLKKIGTFLKSLPGKIIALVGVVIFFVLFILFKAIKVKPLNQKVKEMLNKSIDKVVTTKEEIVVEKVAVDTTKHVEIKKIEEEKVKLETRMAETNKIPDKRRRLEEMMKLHNEIKKRRQELKK